MPIHPPAPADLPGLFAAWRASIAALVDLGRACSDADFARPTACPGWSVQDQLAHVASVESLLMGAEPLSADVPDYPHIRHEMGAFMEEGVEARRGWAGAAVVDELDAVLAQGESTYAAPGRTLDAPVASPLGEMTVGDLLTLRIMDAWVHEQDVRAALERPGGWDTGAAAVFVEGAFARLPRLLGPVLRPGEAVLFAVTGPVAGATGVGLLALSDEPGEVALAQLDDPGQWAGEVALVPLSTETFTRRAAGRIPATAARGSGSGAGPGTDDGVGDGTRSNAGDDRTVSAGHGETPDGASDSLAQRALEALAFVP